MSLMHDLRIGCRDLWSGPWIVIAVTLTLLAYVWATLHLTHGEFTYAVDDAYIHIELAKHILHGHYGINEGELAAPSSSVIWPLLLAPFAVWDTLLIYMPLIIGVITAGLTGMLVFRVFRTIGVLPALLVTMILTYTLNVYGLPIYGMEHGLQVLLTVVVAAGLIRPASIETSRPHRLAFYTALTLLPLVRYDSLALVLPVWAYMLYRGDYRNVLTSGIIAGGLLSAFSGFLYFNDLGILPQSVTTKSRVFDLTTAASNIQFHLLTHQAVVLAAAVVCISQWSTNKLLGLVIAAFTVLFFTFENPVAVGRYEPFFFLFITLIGMDALIAQRRALWTAVFATPLLFASTAFYATLAPASAADIHAQQGHMGKIAQQLNAPLAVNDLGLVALYTDHLVLDLMGLASQEAGKLRTPSRRLALSGIGSEDTSWDVAFMKKHDVHYAMVYADHFSPDGWIPVGTLDLHRTAVIIRLNHVTMFAETPAHARHFRKILSEYAAAHPSADYGITLFAPTESSAP